MESPQNAEVARPLTLIEALTPILCLVVLVGCSYFLFVDAGASGPNQVGLLVAKVYYGLQLLNPIIST